MPDAAIGTSLAVEPFGKIREVGRWNIEVHLIDVGLPEKYGAVLKVSQWGLVDRIMLHQVIDLSVDGALVLSDLLNEWRATRP